MKQIYANNQTLLQLGRQGENLARQVVFDLSSWVAEYGSGVAELIYQRNGDAAPYPVAAVRDGNTLVWTLTATDTAVASSYVSNGHCELRYYAGDVLAKSATWPTKVIPAMSTPSETAPPEPEQGWVDQVVAVGAAVKAAAAQALEDLRALYQEMQTWAQGVIQNINDAGGHAVQSVQSAGDAQVQRVTDEGTRQTSNAKAKADAAKLSADNAAQSATEAGNAKTAAETAKDAAVTAQGKAEDAQRGSEAARDRAETAAIKQPYPNADTGTWWTWDAGKAAYVDSGEPYADQPHVLEVSGAEVSLTLANNTETRCTDPVTALTIEGFAAGDDGKAEQWGIVFTAGDTITVTVPDTLVWAVAEPIFTAGSTYWLSVVPLGGKYLAAWTEVSNESESA